MNYSLFHCTRIGAAHIKKGMPCQDASEIDLHNGISIAVVADGHGSLRHFRSEKGSLLACRTALEEIRKLTNSVSTVQEISEENIEKLKKDICLAWRESVLADHRSNPLSEMELSLAGSILSEEQLRLLIDGSEVPLLYGSTLLAVFADENSWIALQLGDGAAACFSRDGKFTWPMPESFVNEGNITASLCMDDPMSDFRHCRGEGRPAGMFVYTDGIEKVYPSCSREIASLLYWIWRNEKENSGHREEGLIRTLDTVTSQSPYGDDLSIAGFIDPDAGDISPKASYQQRVLELKRIRSRIAEVDSAIAYNIEKLNDICNGREGDHSEIVDQLLGIIERREKELDELRSAEEELLKAMEE